MAGPSFAERLRQHRLSRGLTQAELAERAGLSGRGISDLERGLKHAPRASTVRLLIRGLDLPESEAAALLRAAQPGLDPGSELGPGQERHNLPLPTTSFVPRAGEMLQLEEVLRERSLVTITGAGGCGKTRLALEVAWAHVDRFADGVWLVELASLADASRVTQSTSATLGIPSSSGPQDEALIDFLRNREVLLILDNCEHVIEACALLVERLLRSCSGLRVLATSRERLDVRGEAIHQVTGLAFPAEGATAEDVARSEAGQLFLERAQRLADLTLDAPAAAALARICRRLDGIPLALELASSAPARSPSKTLPCGSMTAFGCSGTPRTAPARHQTLRATMDWSHQLLDADEVALFRRLSVFAGGFDLDAVEAVHGADALPALLRLIDKSLVDVERRRRGQRYRMLETVRQYAEDKLIDSGEAAALRDRHRDHYLAVAEDGIAGVRGPDQVAWLERLELEHDNLRGALAWCQADPEGAEKEERIAGALGRFWRDRGYNQEGFDWCAHAAARAPGRRVGRTRPGTELGRWICPAWRSRAPAAGCAARGSVTVLRQAGDPSS